MPCVYTWSTDYSRSVQPVNTFFQVPVSLSLLLTGAQAPGTSPLSDTSSAPPLPSPATLSLSPSLSTPPPNHCHHHNHYFNHHYQYWHCYYHHYHHHHHHDHHRTSTNVPLLSSSSPSPKPPPSSSSHQTHQYHCPHHHHPLLAHYTQYTFTLITTVHHLSSKLRFLLLMAMSLTVWLYSEGEGVGGGGRVYSDYVNQFVQCVSGWVHKHHYVMIFYGCNSFFSSFLFLFWHTGLCVPFPPPPPKTKQKKTDTNLSERINILTLSCEIQQLNVHSYPAVSVFCLLNNFLLKVASLWFQLCC